MADFLAKNWWYILLAGAIGYRMFKGGGCCGGHSHEDHNHGEGGHNNTNKQNRSENMNIDMVKDPVCGMYVYPNNAIQEVVEGKIYYFCSESCRNKFLNTKAAV